MILSYRSLQFEVTRRCNQCCDHCCRGDSQNLDLSKEIVDKFFENKISYIGYLSFSGGEPGLNVEMVEYIIDKIIENKIEVIGFCLSTNGLVYSERLILAINKLNEYIRTKVRKSAFSRFGTISISNTQFHKEPSEEAVREYSKYDFFIPYNGMRYLPSEYILPFGNAVKNGLTHAEPDYGKIMDYATSYSIKEHEGERYMVFNSQYISSNGNILIDGCMSYDMMDKYAIGNVVEDKIENIYLKRTINTSLEESSDTKAL